MKASDIKEFLKKLFPDKIADVDKLDIKDEAAPAPAAAATGNVSSEVAAAIAPYLEQIKNLSQTLENEKKVREQMQSATESAQKAQREKAIVDLLADAVTKGKITPEQKQKYTERLNKDFELTKSIIEELAPNPALAGGGDDAAKVAAAKAAAEAAGPKIGVTPGGKILDAILTQNKNAAIQNTN